MNKIIDLRLHLSINHKGVNYVPNINSPHHIDFIIQNLLQDSLYTEQIKIEYYLIPDDSTKTVSKRTVDRFLNYQNIGDYHETSS